MSMSKDIPNQTANGYYNFDQYFLGHRLCDLVIICHKRYSSIMKWKYRQLKPGQFGYDNMAMALGYVLTNMNNNSDLAELAELAHKGWIINYKFWRDDKPFSYDSAYKKPFENLGDERRNKCAETDFCDLDKEEQVKDKIIAQFVIDMKKSFMAFQAAEK